MTIESFRLGKEANFCSWHFSPLYKGGKETKEAKKPWQRIIKAKVCLPKIKPNLFDSLSYPWHSFFIPSAKVPKIRFILGGRLEKSIMPCQRKRRELSEKRG